MARSAFETLEVYCLAEQLADEIWKIVIRWDRFARDRVGGQLVEAADSVGANIAEGFGRGATPDNRRFVRIARGSLNETIHFLRRAYRRKLITQDQVAKLKPLIEKLGPKLNAYYRSIGSSGTPRTQLSGRAVRNNKQQTTNHKQRLSGS